MVLSTKNSDVRAGSLHHDDTLLELIRSRVSRLSDDEERNFLRHFSPAVVFVHLSIYWSLS